jgi:hypothetical protein
MAIKRKQKARDRGKEKIVEVPRHAAKVFKKRQDQLDSRKRRDAGKREDVNQAAARITREITKQP